MSTPYSESASADASEEPARASATLYGQDVRRETGRSINGRWRHRAHLLGGTADGRAVQLDSLIPEIAVYVADGRTIACDRLLPHAGEGRFIGVYQLATGSGPEPPVYVAGV